jgi:hypothetical protein
MDAENVIPKHDKGIQTNTRSSIEFSSEDEAKDFFKIVRKRLLAINKWHEYAGSATADFQLTDEMGNSVDRVPEKGDHLKINIPGPGTIAGEGNDWVKIEAVEEDENHIGIRVRPATNPTNEKKDIAHFFDEEATSSFIVKREDKKVTAAVYGRNEKPNTNTKTVIDKLRNTAIATGAVSGFSKLQWKSLVNGLIKKD